MNLVGFLEGEFGLGEIARRLAGALRHAGIPHAAISYRRTASRQAHRLDFELLHEVPYDTNIICLNADYLPTFVDDAGVGFFADRYSIGVWFWETSAFRVDDHGGFRLLDEIWVASDYVRRAVGLHASIPLHVAPLPVGEPPATDLTRAELGLPSAFMFLYAFDFVSAERKNPRGVLEAFTNAFAPGEGPVLVLKSINGKERKPHLLAELEAAAASRPDVVIVDGYVSAAQRDALVAACDCYVSLHRSEGFGLTMAEAMAHGKPVIATGYSGNLQFMDDGTSYLVPFRLVPIPSHWWAYSPEAEWADPDAAAAATLMRRVYESQEEARALGARAREHILESLSLARTVAFIEDRLSAATVRRSAMKRAGTHVVRTAIIRASQEHARGVGGGLTSNGGGRGPIALARRLLLRAMWPYLESQHRFDGAVLDALRRLEDSASEQVAESSLVRRSPTGKRSDDC